VVIRGADVDPSRLEWLQVGGHKDTHGGLRLYYLC
jgi:hypothetical protein